MSKHNGSNHSGYMCYEKAVNASGEYLFRQGYLEMKYAYVNIFHLSASLSIGKPAYGL